MTRTWPRAVIEALLAGWVLTGLFAAATTTFGPYSVVRLPYGLTALGDVVVGIVLALLAVDLRRMVIEVAVAAVVSAVFYGLLAVSPAIVAPDYAVTLANFALTQVVAVLFLSFFLGLIGALIGTVINSTVRGYEL